MRPTHSSHNSASQPGLQSGLAPPTVGLAPPTRGPGLPVAGSRLWWSRAGSVLRPLVLAGPALRGMWAGVSGLRGSCSGLQALRGGHRAALFPGRAPALHTSVASCGSKNLLKKFASKTRYARIRVCCGPGRRVHCPVGWRRFLQGTDVHEGLGQDHGDRC